MFRQHSFRALGLVLFIASLGEAATLKLPAEVKGAPAEFLRVPADTDGKVVRWIVLDKGLSLFPTDLLKDTRTAVVVAREPGRYRLLPSSHFLKIRRLVSRHHRTRLTRMPAP